MLQENENNEVIDLEKCNINDLISRIEKDPIPTNIFDIDETDPLVLLGKMNEIIACLKSINALIANSDNKASEALTKAIEAIENATLALSSSNLALDNSNNALDTANQAITSANQALENAINAENNSNEAKTQSSEALNKANEALERVVAGLGTKIYDTHDNLLADAKFTGHNGINVDMDETDPQTFNIRLDNTITEAIENNHKQGQTNASNISAEIERATNAEQINEASIKNEATRAKQAENGLDSRITTNTTNIANEITRAKSAESAVDTKATTNATNIANIGKVINRQQLNCSKNLTITIPKGTRFIQFGAKTNQNGYYIWGKLIPISNLFDYILYLYDNIVYLLNERDVFSRGKLEYVDGGDQNGGVLTSDLTLKYTISNQAGFYSTGNYLLLACIS